MATTLEFLSNHGIVHTDIKPDNIMLVDMVNQPLRVKMIDFGLARHVSQAQWGSFLQPLCYRLVAHVFCVHLRKCDTHI